MGQSKTFMNSGYNQLPTLNPEQLSLLSQVIRSSQPHINQAAEGFQQFLPGGGGGQHIINAAMNQYQQRTIPSILNALGTDSKGSSGLNQALAASASDLNTNLGAQLANMQLNAASGLGNLGLNQQSQGLGTQSFRYQQAQPPMWQQLLGPLIGAASSFGSAGLLGSAYRAGGSSVPPLGQAAQVY
jgi:hypothetical protein